MAMDFIDIDIVNQVLIIIVFLACGLQIKDKIKRKKQFDAWLKASGCKNFSSLEEAKERYRFEEDKKHKIAEWEAYKKRL